MTATKTTKHVIDARGKSLGRIASEAAKALRGKMSPAFTPNQVSRVDVEIVNAKAAKIMSRNLRGKVYRHYTGYPGGLKQQTMEEMIKEKGYQEVFRKAVYGMLPANKLRSRIIKHLQVTE